MERKSAIASFVILATLALTRLCTAQEDPFGAAPKPAADGAKAKPPVVTEEAKPEPLAIQLLRASKPTTPRELLAAAQSALQLGRADEAKRYLAQLLTDKPSDDALAALAASYADFLLQLTQNKDLQPEGKQVAEQIYAASARVVQSSERIEQAIRQLSDPQPVVQQEALDKLAAAGVQVVNPMLKALADGKRETEHRNIRNALVELGETLESPLVGALDTDNEVLKQQVISVLARIGSRRAVPLLIRPAIDPSAPTETRQLASAGLQRITGSQPDLYESQKYLHTEINQLLHGDLQYETDADNRVQLWLWNRAVQAVEPALLTRRDAAWLLAARLASDLYVIQPRDDAARRLMLLTNLQWAKIVTGLDKPLPIGAGTAGAVAVAAGPQVVGGVLADSLKGGYTAAAIAAAEVLSQIGDRALLYAPAGEMSSLGLAITYPDRRVRLAAALAAAKIADGDSFAGAGKMVDALSWFIETSGNDTVLVAHPRGEDAQELVSFMNVLGYQAEAAYVGRQVAARAMTNPDYPFILVVGAIDSPPVLELVQWLRRDYRTARLPIGVMARGDRLQSLRDAFEDDAFTAVFPRVHSADVASIEVDRLKVIAGRNLVSADERVAQAKAAIAALTKLAQRRQTFLQYDLLRLEPTIIRALTNPSLTADAAALLALYGTPKAQAALAEMQARQLASP
jgi:hypothetical protein